MLAFIGAILWFARSVSGQSCSNWDTEFECLDSGGASCLWLADASVCKCASQVAMDIFIGVDISGSIGWTDFQIEKEWLEGMVTAGVSDDARIGFDIFSTNTNISRVLTTWTYDDLLSYVRGIRWRGGLTNTGQLLADTITQFETYGDSERQKILMIITDGNPCDSSACPKSVCAYSDAISDLNIRTIIIGVGQDWATQYVSCLCETADDVIRVDGFSQSAFDDVLGYLFSVLCPISMEAVVTEVHAQINEQCTWCDRFIEIYNSGVEFNTNTISLNGLLSGTGTDTTVSQGQYVVFYDADQGWDGTASTDNGMVTCHLCDSSVCTLDTCPITTTSATVECWCENSVYIPCGSGAGCLYTCCFNNAMDNENWYIEVDDEADALVDSVTWTTDWITVEDGFAYELLGKNYDNDAADNWVQSCSEYGTPGTDPAATCTPVCSSDQCDTCDANGVCASCESNQCECDALTGYYPSCTGGACTTCRLVPEVETCDVTWVKNGTDAYAIYVWTDIDFDGSYSYELTYFSQSQGGDTLTATTEGELIASVDDYYRGNDTIGGYVRTVIEQCYNKYGDSEDLYCGNFYSEPTWCVVATSTPTTSPTPAPTSPPTPKPSVPPTGAPTLQCPIYYFTNADMCDPERCNCNGVSNPDCCISYDENLEKYHEDTAECRIDAQDGSSSEDTNDDTYGYILDEKTHYFSVAVEAEDYPCNMTICWELQFDSIDCDYCSDTEDSEEECDERRRRRRRRNLLQTNMTDSNMTTTDATTTADETTAEPGPTEPEATGCSASNIESAGLEIDNLAGCVEMEGAADEAGGLFEFTVTKLTDSDYGDVAIYGYLKMVNATSQCQPNCEDGRVYPMDIPVWFNSNAALSASDAEEEELPAWLWWLVAAIAVFLGVLGFLVYKYWYAAKKTGAALAEKDKELQAAIEEDEMGFGGPVGNGGTNFNPMATGHVPNAGGGVNAPNMPMGNQGGQGQFVQQNVEKFAQRQQFAPRMG